MTSDDIEPRSTNESSAGIELADHIEKFSCPTNLEHLLKLICNVANLDEDNPVHFMILAVIAMTVSLATNYVLFFSGTMTTTMPVGVKIFVLVAIYIGGLVWAYRNRPRRPPNR